MSRGVLLEPGYRDKVESVHLQLPGARQAVKVTHDHHDHGIVTVREHYSDRVDVNVKPETVDLGLRDFRAEQFTPFVYAPLDGKPLILWPGGRALPVVAGGSVTISGLFTTNWVQTLGLGTPDLNLLSSHQRCAMYPTTITPNFDDTTLSHEAYNGTGGQYIAANENTGTGYSAGGAGDSSASGTFSSPTVTNTAGVISFSTSNAVWTASTITSAGCCLIYDNSLSPKAAYCLIYFGGPYSTSAGTFTIQVNASGWFTWTVHA